MGRYEATTPRSGDLDSNDSFPAMKSWSHEDGAMAILKVWNNSPSHNPATLIVKQARRVLIKSSLLRNLPLPEWFLNGNAFGERDLELDYDRIVTRMVNLRYTLGNLQQKKYLSVAKLEELGNDVRELDEALQGWAATLPKAWSFDRHILTERDPWPKRHFYSSTIYSYSKPGYAVVWSQYFAARMLINSMRLKVLDMTDPSSIPDFTYEQQRLECVTQLTAMADSLASTIPCSLGRVKVTDDPNRLGRQTSLWLNTDEEIEPYLADQAVWPLTIASSLRGIQIRQQQWFKSELASLGRVIGTGVLECAETDQWAVL